jgi:methyl-accepting chemotaxis protein
MPSNWTFGKKIGGGFAVAGLTLFLVALFGYESTHRLLDNVRWVSHTQEVRRNTAELGGLLMTMESGYRGYVITGLEDFLEPYEFANGRIDKCYETLRELTSDNPTQRRNLDTARIAIENKRRECQLGIDVRRSQGFEAAASLVLTRRGKGFTDEVRHLIDELDSAEAKLLRVREVEAEASSAMTKAVILWGSLAGLVFIAAVGWFISGSLGRQIGSAVSHIQSSSAELQAAANQQASGSKEQATAMSEITTTISELLATSRQIAGSSQRVAMIASDTAGAAQAGDRLVQRTNESIASIRRQVDLIVTHMLDLGKKSQEIGGILELINELAEQTNILAINATIEAAGAGDSGRRFAVVADEIRRLADRVAGSTKEIRDLIDEMRAAVNTTVMATESGTKAVDAGARQFGEAATSFGQITSLVGTTTEAAREIELSTKQQSTAVEQVNVAAANVAQAIKEMEASSSQTLQTASQLATLSRDLLRVVQSSSTA